MNDFLSLLISTLFASALCASTIIYAETTTSVDSSPTSLCPPAGALPSVRLQKLQETITTPQTVQEIEARRQQLASSQPLQRYAAIVALAFAGDLEVFKQLLHLQKASDIQVFALNYRSPDGSRCLTPPLEQLIIRHLGNSALRTSLYAFLKKNLYRSPTLFEALIAQQPAMRELNAMPHFVQALTATHLPDVTARILLQATTFQANATPRLAAAVLDTHRLFINYFARRRYVPALDYLAALLNTLQTLYASQPKRYAQTAITNMRSSIYRALVHFPSPDAAQIALTELALLSRNVWQPGTTTLLTQLGEVISAATTRPVQRDQAAQLIAALLTANPPLSSHAARPRRARGVPTNEAVRRHSYQLLVALQSRTAIDVLLDDLQRVVALPLTERPQGVLTQLLESLRHYPAEVELDIPRFLQLASKLDAPSQLSIVPDILAQRPHPQAHTYLLSRLEQVLRTEDDAAGTGIIASKKSYQRHLNYIYGRLFKLVMQYDAPQALTKTRQQIDHLYALGILPEPRYVTASDALNAILGDQSPQYAAYLEAQDARQAEATRRKQEQYIDELRAKHHLGKYATAATIQEDIEALSSSGNEKQVARRLIITGAAVLPYAHAAIADPAIPLRSKMRLMDIVSAIGDARSVGPIIAVAHQEPRLYRTVMLTLSKLPPTAESFAFAAQQLTQQQDPKRQSAALMYFALQQDRRATAWATAYVTPDRPPEVRLAALYLAARLGDQSAKAPILHLLRTAPKRSHRTLLLRALAELVKVDAFKALARQLRIDENSKDYRNVLLYVEFKQAGGEDKIAPAEALLLSRDLFYPSHAARYLLAQNRIDVLEKYVSGRRVYHLPLDLAMLLSKQAALIVVEARRMGLDIDVTAKGLRLNKRGG